VDGVLARQMMTAAQVRSFAGDGPTNSDDHNRLEYEAPVAFWARAKAEIPDARFGRLEAQGLTLGTRADAATQGPASITLTDPDGNAILIDQHR